MFYFQLIGLFAIPLMWKLNKNSKSAAAASPKPMVIVEGLDERTKLLSSGTNNNNSANINSGYKSIETA
jgi:hypothetical protein